MLDIKRIKDNPEAVKAGLRAKEVDCDAQVDRILELVPELMDRVENMIAKKKEEKEIF